MRGLKMKTLKLSYSIINAWEQGQYEQAIAYYLGKDFPATPAMELGRVKDQIWTQYAEKNNKLHPELGGDELSNVHSQEKLQKIIPFSEEYQILFRGIPDLTYETHADVIITDYKCGLTPASAYVDKWQLDGYKLLIPKATLGFYLCFNPYSNELTKGVKFLTSKNAENAVEHIITTGGEILDYLLANRLFKDYKLS
jgi:hypothetical protein